MLKIRNKFTVGVLTVLILVFGCFTRTDGLKQSDIKPLVTIFLAKHVRYHEFNDEISKRTMHNFINFVDPGKYYFYKSDIDSFFSYDTKIGSLIENGRFSIIFDVFALYKKRFDENMVLLEDLLKQNFDFNQDETITIDSDKIDYPASKAEMRERWRKNVKLQLLNYLPAVKNAGEAKEKLRNKYRITKKRIAEIDNNRMISIFINAFTTALDPHSNYLSQEEHEDFMISTRLKLEGIGVLLRSEDGFVMVESIIPGGAAAKLPAQLRLKPNDKIVGVAQADEDPVDVIDMDLRDVVKMIRGKSGKVVKLTIIRKTVENGKQTRMVIPIAREEIKLEDKAAKSEIHSVRRATREVRIGYIRLPSFYLDFDAIQRNDPAAKSSSNDVIMQINKLKGQKIDGMILDLRGNPGGALNEAVNVAGLFIDQGPIVEIRDGNNAVDVMNDDDPGVYYDGPLVVLIDRFSASASEIFAGAIKDYHRGVILGPTNTFGKGSVQSYNPLPSKKGAVKITTALFYQPAGTSNQLNGIAPDIIIPDLSSIWEIGENKLKYPIKWERIKGAHYVPYSNYVNAALLASLQRNSGSRIASSKKFSELITKINTLRKRIQTKEISLKEEAAMEKQKMRDIEKQEKGNEAKLIDLDNDLFLLEAFDVTADYVELVK